MRFDANFFDNKSQNNLQRVARLFVAQQIHDQIIEVMQLTHNAFYLGLR